MSDRSGRGQLAAYLRTCRLRLDPGALGYASGRRRTPGLRREEVAQRACISATWYTWLEQGRGGAPSAEVLNRIAHALMLTEIEREHLFLLGLGHPPGARSQEIGGVTPRLQGVLDALEPTPALIRTATWQVLAWNRGVPVLFTDYGAQPLEERNIIRHMFLSPAARAAQPDWESVARFVVGAFRADAARAGAAATAEMERLVADLARLSPEFEMMWRESAIFSPGEIVKRIRHPVLGPVEFEHSTFAVDGRADLSMVVYRPVAPDILTQIAAMIAR